MGSVNTRTINLPLYLKVLEQLPGVDAEQTATVHDTFAKAYAPGTIPRTLTFDRGLFRGDGDILLRQNWAGYDGRTHQTTLHMRSGGHLSNNESGFRSRLPRGIAPLFFGGIFGADELEDYLRIDLDVQGALAAGWAEAVPTADPSRKPNRSPYDAILSEGAYQLYSCAAKKGSIEACSSSTGMRLIDAVEKRMANEEKSYDIAVAKKQETDRLEKERTEREAVEKKKQDQIAAYQKTSESTWKEVESYHKYAMDEDWKIWVHPDDIMAIMDRYRSYRFYGGTNDELGNARIRAEMADKMLGEIGHNKTGRRYFKKNHCRVTWSERYSCGMDESGSGGTKSTYTCSHGVKGWTSHDDDCKKREKRDFSWR